MWTIIKIRSVVALNTLYLVFMCKLLFLMLAIFFSLIYICILYMLLEINFTVLSLSKKTFSVTMTPFVE